MLLSREAIQKIDDLKKKTFPVPEWGGEIILCEPTAYDMDAYNRSLVHTKMVDSKAEVVTDYSNAKARLVVKCVLNEDGSRMFADGDADWLGRKSALVIGRIFDEIEKLAGADTPLEERAKNSETTQS